MRRTLIDKGGRPAQHRKTVGESFRHPKMTLVFSTQDRRRPLTESRRADADIDSDIVNLAFENADQLALRIRPLIMQATQHALFRARDIGLHEAEIQPGFGEAFGIEALVEKSARIPMHFRLDDQTSVKRGLDQLHAGRPSRTSSCRYWP